MSQLFQAKHKNVAALSIITISSSNNTWLQHTIITSVFFKGYLSKILFRLFLNNLPHIFFFRLKVNLLAQNQQWKHQNIVWNMFKVNNKITKTTCRCSGVFIVCFEQTLQNILEFLLLTLNKYMPVVVVQKITAEVYLGP